MRKRELVVVAALVAAALVLAASAAGTRAPLVLTWPTSADVEPDGSILVVENGDQTHRGRVVRINPATGRTRVVAQAEKAYAVAHSPSGVVYFSAKHQLLRLGSKGATTVATADADIGPVAVAGNGDVYFTTETQVMRVAGGSGTPSVVAGELSGPHGLAVTADGALLVSDTGRRRVVRIDPKTDDVERWGSIGNPRGIAIARDGTTYIVNADSHRVVHLLADGRRLGATRHVFFDPYAVAVAPNGSLYVVDTAASGRLYRIAPNGTTTVVR